MRGIKTRRGKFKLITFSQLSFNYLNITVFNSYHFKDITLLLSLKWLRYIYTEIQN